jgi:hypothetical protein
MENFFLYTGKYFYKNPVNGKIFPVNFSCKQEIFFQKQDFFYNFSCIQEKIFHPQDFITQFSNVQGKKISKARKITYPREKFL